MRNLIIILFALTLYGCFDENSYVIKPIPTDPNSIQVKIPYYIYETETFFNLNDTTIVSHNYYADWDLGFEASTTGYHVILNGAKFMYAEKTGSTDFYAIPTVDPSKLVFDNSNGNLDSTAIDNWADFSNPLNPIYPKNVYIIDRGVDENGISFGLKKIVFEKLENDKYYIHYANLDNSDEYYFQIPKNSSENFVQFSFNSGGNTSVQEPDKDLWDFNFTKYATIIMDYSNINHPVPTPYPVRGVLINYGLLVAKDTITPYNSINYSSISGYTFSANKDAIGYDWKKYTNGQYVVIDHYTYIIRDRNNNYYKLRFTGFKNTIKGDINYGKNGYPTFEYVRLKNT